MESSEIKKLIIRSMDPDADPKEIAGKLEDEGVSFDFRKGFSDRVIDKLFGAGLAVNRQVEFLRSFNSAFYRVAITGIAAIILLMISLFLMEGSISFNSFLGIGDSYDESIVCLLTGD